MKATLGLLVLLLSGSTACAGAPSQQPVDNRVSPSATATPQPSVVYQAQGTIWVRLPGSSAVVDAGSGLDGTPEHPDWSPDGKRLVVETDFSEIWTLGGDGSHERRVYACKGACFYVEQAAWSPDGREIAFVEVQTKDGETTSRALLRVMDVAGGHVRAVMTDRTGRVGYYSPRWSDDGHSLVFEEDVFASTLLAETVVKRARVVTVRADGRLRRVLASWRGPITGPGSPEPDWSGTRVVFVRDDNLLLMDVGNGSLQPLTTYDGVTEHAIQPTFSGDGRHIAFTLVRGSFGVDDQAEGALVDVKTGVVTTLDFPGATHVRLRPQGL
jgi:Tol biopolymer transport system component